MNKELLLFFIKLTLENEEHLGDNLKKQCVNYVESLQQENKQLKEAINKITEIINYYGVNKEYNDNVILRHILKDMLDILKEVSE